MVSMWVMAQLPRLDQPTFGWHTHTNTHKHTHTHIQTHTQTHAHMHACTHVRLYTHALTIALAHCCRDKIYKYTHFNIFQWTNLTLILQNTITKKYNWLSWGSLLDAQHYLKPYKAVLICISTDAFHDINAEKSTYFVMCWQSTDCIPLYFPALFLLTSFSSLLREVTWP